MVKTRIVSDACTQQYYVVEIENGQDILHQYKDTLQTIADNKEKIIYEKIFMSPSHVAGFQNIHRSKRECGLLHPIQATIQNQKNKSWALIYTVYYKKPGHLRYISQEGTPVGTEYSLDSARKTIVFNIWPQKDTVLSSIRNDFCLMADRMKKEDIRLLRTWFYLKNIRSNYETFNTLRKEFFDCVAIDYSSSSNILPASTCIEIKNQIRHCHMGFEFVQNGGGIRTKRIYNKLQKEATEERYLFHPSFSRAVCTDYQSFSEVHISGTASIGQDGNSVYVGDAYRQIKKTLENVRSLLGAAGIDFSQIVYATCFFKNPDYMELFEKACKELRIEKFPCIILDGNVCREELLFELDGVAVKSKYKVGEKQ